MNRFDMVIYGGNGDLSMRKLLPAMYRAFKQGNLHDEARIIVCCRKEEDFETLLPTIKEAIIKFVEPELYSEETWESFTGILRPLLIDLLEIEKGWDELAKLLAGREDAERLFYLAVMPSLYSPCCEKLSAKNLITEKSRVIVEKPLGYDHDSAEEINNTIGQYFEEEQIYRIDHYLGKETVQNLLALRFSNFLFENIWDNKAIEHIQISICEQVGLEGRAGFYDEVGALRDMVQNHLLQLLCLVAIDNPNALSAEEVRIEKIKVLRALKAIPEEEMDKHIVRGQYVSGKLNDEKVDGYLDELEDFDSKTETFVALKAYIDNWRWAGVPFYLRTGKRLKHRIAEIIVQFKNVTHNVYGDEAHRMRPNKLILQLQPDETIQLQLMANDVGSGTECLKPIVLNLDFSPEGRTRPSTAYQRLLMDAIEGNPTLFIHREEVKAAWQWIDPIIEHWKKSEKSPELYAAGSWGPAKANDLFDRPSNHWISLTELEQG